MGFNSKNILANQIAVLASCVRLQPQSQLGRITQAPKLVVDFPCLRKAALSSSCWFWCGFVRRMAIRSVIFIVALVTGASRVRALRYHISQLSRALVLESIFVPFPWKFLLFILCIITAVSLCILLAWNSSKWNECGAP